MRSLRVSAWAALAWSAALLMIYSARYAAPVLALGARLVYRGLVAR